MVKVILPCPQKEHPDELDGSGAPLGGAVVGRPPWAAWPWPSTPEEIGKPEGRVDIVAWPGYIERGETDKNYDWVTQFEKRPAARST